MAPGLQLNIKDLAQALFLVLGPDEVGNKRRSEVSADEAADLEKQLWITLARTRTVSNSSVSVNRLPPEVLARIFFLLQPPIPESTFPLPKAFYCWFSVLEVCRYWRITTLVFPQLWNHVYIREPFDDSATMSIRHSGTMPLKVYYHLNPNKTSENRYIEDQPLFFLSKEVHRVQELYLNCEAWDNQFLMETFTSPAPTLQSLALLGSWKSGNSDDFLPLLFSNCTPRLKSVIFSYISCDPLDNFRNLTHLSLYNQTAPPRRPSLDKFLQILRYSPDLEELVLVRAGPDEGQPVLPPETTPTPVSLPRLRVLEIGYYRTPNIHFLLSHLIIPKQATRCIFDHQLADLAAFLNVAADGPYAQILRVVITGGRSFEQMFGIKGATLYIHGRVDFVQIHSLFSEAILPNVQELIFSPLPENMPSSPQLCHMLCSLPHLTTLTLAGAARVHLHRSVSALGLFHETQVTVDATDVMNPHLCVIKVFNYLQSESNQDSYLDILPLVLLSQARAEIGHPIQRLEIEDCRRDQLEELQGHLGATELLSHERPFGEQIFGTLSDEMWNAIRDSAPIL